MGIRPVDMQIVVQKTQEIHPAKQSVVNKQENELQHAQIQNKENVEKTNQMVNNTKKTDFNKVKNDQKREDEKKSKKAKHATSDKEEENDSSHKDVPYDKYGKSGTRFDIKV